MSVWIEGVFIAVTIARLAQAWPSAGIGFGGINDCKPVNHKLVHS